MSRTFAYVRVSTVEQTSENQIQEIKAAGFNIEPHRIITETVSGSRAIAQRHGFSRLLDKMEKGDILMVLSHLMKRVERKRKQSKLRGDKRVLSRLRK